VTRYIVTTLFQRPKRAGILTNPEKPQIFDLPGFSRMLVPACRDGTELRDHFSVCKNKHFFILHNRENIFILFSGNLSLFL